VFADAVRPALEEVLAKSNPPADRRAALAAALDAVLEEVGELPVSRTASLFDEAPKGKGALLALGIDPTMCQTCGVCIEACEPAALTDGEASADRRRRDLGIHGGVRQLPAPSAATLDRIREPAGLAAALLLGPENRSTMSGGDHAEPASGARLALRLVLAATVSHLAPRLAAFMGELDELRAKFAEEIRSGMLDAIPTNDLDAIAQGLRVLGGPDVDVAELIKRVEDACDSDRIDAERLSALVDAAKDVANLRDACARTASPPVPPPLVLAGESLEWAATFPDNPFAGPVVVDAGRSAARVALGLSEGTMRDVARGAGVARRARAALAQPLALAATEPPSWSELEDAERAWAPPVTLVLDAATWGRQELSAVEALLGSSRPVVVVVLSDRPVRPSPALHALARRDVFTLQSSIAFPDHLVSGLADALSRVGPALVHVLAPSPSAAGVGTEQLIERARQPVEARAFPLFRYEPREGSIGRLSLDDNPEILTTEARSEDLAAWETLTELAGIGGPGVEHAREEGRTAERDAARREWEPRIDDAAREAREEMEQRLTSQLMTLSGWGPHDESTP
jgi:pyruvate-ferredoxin/flavodoxin oxidoreductase